MSSEWRETTLGELINIKHGYAFKGKFFSDFSTNNILLTPGNFHIGGGFKDDKLKYYEGEVPEDYILQKGDVIVTMTDLSKTGDTLGYSAKIPKTNKNFLHNQRLGLIQLKSNQADLNFIYWLLRTKTYQKTIVNSASGSTVRHTSPSKIQDYTFLLPPLEKQKQIASVLTCLDDKIDNLRRQNETLEKIAQLLFKRWFIDFEFPNDDGQPYKSSGGEMVTSELGDIPVGWRVGKLRDVVKRITKGTTPTTLKRKFVTEGINFIKVESITNNNTLDNSKFAYIDEETNQILNRSILEEKDILYTIAGTIGRHAMVSQNVLPANTNQAVAIIRLNFEEITPEYLLCYFGSQFYQHYTNSRIVQAVQANLSLGELGDSPIVLSDITTRKLFSDFSQPIYLKKVSNENQIQTLTKTRDLLLPKLMSGQIRIEEREEEK